MNILIIVGIIALILIIIAFRTQSKLEKEKAEGKWDYILQEFLPFLESHTEPVKTTEELSFTSYDGTGTASFKGRVHYNSAGIAIEQISRNSKTSIIEFFRGKDEPSRFKPLFESSLWNIQKHNDSIRFNLKTNSTNRKELTIENAPGNLFDELKEVLGSFN